MQGEEGVRGRLQSKKRVRGRLQGQEGAAKRQGGGNADVGHHKHTQQADTDRHKQTQCNTSRCMQADTDMGNTDR